MNLKKLSTLSSVCRLLSLAMSLGSVIFSQAGSFSSSTTAPVVNGADIANLATQTGSDKWFFQTADESNPSDAAKGQTFITGSTTVKFKALTYKISSGNSKAAQTTYKLRVGTISGTTFTQIYSETILQTVNTASGAYMTWTLGTPLTLSPNTTYAIDVGMDSAVAWGTGIPYLAYTGNISNARIGSYYDSGDLGVGNATMTFTTARDRVFHLDLEDPQNPSPNDGSTVPAGNVVLGWTNLTPATGSNVWVDVWFGTNASALTKVVSAAQNLTTHTVSAPTAATYYWRIDSYLNGVATGTPTTGTRFNFVVADTDADGLPDAFELLHTTPASGTALNPGDDLDSDGLTNLQEYQRGTLPLDNDTDNDTLLDGPELSGVGSRPPTVPTDADSDNDGLNDGVESNTGIWVSTSNRGTNPTKTDTDSDGLSDGAETNSGTYTSGTNTGTSPLLKNSDGDNAEDWYEVAASYTNPTQASSKPNIPYPLPDPDASTGTGTKPVKVFILSGQSNMVGFGRVAGSENDTLQSVTQTEKKFPNLITSTNAWTVRNDVLYRGVISALGDAALKPGFGESSDSFGPELGFGHAIGYIHDEPVLIIKTSIGNRSLGWDFLPPGSARYTYSGATYAGYGDYAKQPGSTTVPANWYAGKQYDDSFLHENDMGAKAWASGLAYVTGSQVKHNGVTYSSKTNHTSSATNAPVPAGNTNWAVYSVFNVCDILDNFATEYPQWATRGFEIGGFGWFQGWNDGQSSETEYAVRYEQNLVRLIKQLRLYYNGRYPGKIQPTAPFVTVTCGFDGMAAAGNRLTVANAQLAVENPTLYPEFAGNVKTMEGRGYWRISGPNTAQNYHYYHNAETYMLVGDAMGRGMIDLLDTAPPPPQNYIWSQTAGGAQSWNTSANWLSSSSPSPNAEDTIDFSTVNILADTALTLGADRTAQTWKFGDVSGAQNWIVSSGNTITLAGTAPSLDVSNNTTQIDSVLTGTSGLAKTGTGNLILTGANTFTGATTISAGTLQIGNNGTTGTLSTASTITNNSALVFQRSNGIVQGLGFANGISGTGSLTNAGSGALTLNVANTYSGLTTINAGSIKVLNANALGATTAGTVVNGTGAGSVSNPRLELEGGITVSGETLTINGVGNFFGALSSTSGSNVWAGNITIGLSGTRLGCTTGNTLTVSGIINSGSVETGLIIRTQDLNSIVILSGANTYLGDTSVLIGKLQLAGGNDRLPPTSRLVMGSSGTNNPDAEFDLNGRNQTVAGVALTGTATKNSINNSSATAATLTINPMAATSFAGILKGNLSLTKIGSSTQALAGANTYSGNTTISSGTLVLGANNVLPDSSNISIGAATLDATTRTDTAGTLNVTAAATINLGTGAALAFANSSALSWSGTLNISGTFVSGSSLRFGTLSTSLTAAQLSKISATGFTGFALDASGFLTASSANAYASWSATNAANTTPEQDQDNDGVNNAVEYVLGGSSLTNDLSKLPTTAISGENVVYTFQRAQSSINASTALSIQVSPSLQAWPSQYNVGANTATSSPGVTVTQVASAGFDTVTLSIPRASDAQKFIRLQVTITP
jgi:alpha-galactosidase